MTADRSAARASGDARPCNARLFVAANAAAFGWSHLLFESWVSIVMCAVGGWLILDLLPRILPPRE